MYLNRFEFWGNALHDNASYTAGNLIINDNVINSEDYGIFMEYFQYWGTNLHDNTTCDLGKFTVNHNDIDATNHGIYLCYFMYLGYELYDNGTAELGSIQFNRNTIDSAGSGIYVGESSHFASQLSNDSSVTMGDMTFNDNTITISDSNYGIYLQWYNIQINIIDNAVSNLGQLLLDGNAITYAQYGIYLDDTDNATISNNDIRHGDHGIYLEAACNNTIIQNMIVNNTEGFTGLHADTDSHINEIHQNCFIDNDPQAHDDGQGNNWDGNYWSDYIVLRGVYDAISGTASSKDFSTLGQCPLKEKGAQVPAMTPIGIIILLGLTAFLAVAAIKKKQK
jgi:parallel beta-helix repeat protein